MNLIISLVGFNISQEDKVPIDCIDWLSFTHDNYRGNIFYEVGTWRRENEFQPYSFSRCQKVNNTYARLENHVQYLQYSFNGSDYDGVNILKVNDPVTSDLRWYQYYDSNGVKRELPAGAIVISCAAKSGDEGRGSNHGWITLGNLGTSDALTAIKVINRIYGTDIPEDSPYVYSVGSSNYWYIESSEGGVKINNADPDYLYRKTFTDQNGKQVTKTVGTIWAFQVAEDVVMPNGSYHVYIGKKDSDNLDGDYVPGITYGIGKKAEGDSNIVRLSKVTETELVDVFGKINIADTSSYDVYYFSEQESESKGYIRQNGEYGIQVIKKLSDSGSNYVIDHVRYFSGVGDTYKEEPNIALGKTYWILADRSTKENPTAEEKQNAIAYISVAQDGTSFTYTGINKHLEGKYNVYIGKKDSESVNGEYVPGITYNVGKKADGDTSVVNETKVTENQLVNVFGDISIKNKDSNDVYYFCETESESKGYQIKEGTYGIQIFKKISGGEYVIDHVRYFSGVGNTYKEEPNIGLGKTYWILADRSAKENPTEEEQKNAIAYVDVAQDGTSFTYVGVNKHITGNYNLYLGKKNSEDLSGEYVPGITYNVSQNVEGVQKISGVKKVTANKLIDLVGDVTITDKDKSDKYVIYEQESVNEGFKKQDVVSNIEVIKKLSNDMYIIDYIKYSSDLNGDKTQDISMTLGKTYWILTDRSVKENPTEEEQKNAIAYIELKSDGSSVTYVGINKPIDGKFSLNIKKINQVDNTTVDGVSFNVNGAIYGPTENGLTCIVSNKKINKNSLQDEKYTISELDLGANSELISLAEPVSIIIHKGINSSKTKYIVTGVNFEGIQEQATAEGNVIKKVVTLKDGTKEDVQIKVQNDVVEITVPNRLKGKYNINIGKKSAKDNKFINSDNNDFIEGAKFTVEQYMNTDKSANNLAGNDLTNKNENIISENGKATAVLFNNNSEIAIDDISKKDIYVIKENDPPAGYKGNNIIYYLEVRKKIDSTTNEYMIDSIDVMAGGASASGIGSIMHKKVDSGTVFWAGSYTYYYRVDFDKATNTITFAIANFEKDGKYNFKVTKVNPSGKKIEDEVTKFDIKVYQNKAENNGTVQFSNEIARLSKNNVQAVTGQTVDFDGTTIEHEDIGKTYYFVVEETEAPDEFTKIDYKIVVPVTFEETANGYEAIKEKNESSFAVDRNNYKKQLSVVENEMNGTKVTEQTGVTINVKVPNKPKEGKFNFLLTKYAYNSSFGLENAEFSVKIKDKLTNQYVQDKNGISIDGTKVYTTDEDGYIEDIIGIPISTAGRTYEVEVNEITPPPGYKSAGKVTFEVVSKDAGSGYILDSTRRPEIENSKIRCSVGSSWIAVDYYDVAETKVSVNKIWDDDNNANNERPAEVKVKLMADGQQKGEEITLNQTNGWEYSWDSLEKYRNNIISDGEILYTVEETVPQKYTATYHYSFENGVKTITIKNTYEKEITSFKVEKVWDDNNNKNGKRPEYILATPYLNGIPCGQSVVLSDAYGWNYTWTGYLKYKDGIASNGLNNYTVVETVPEGYTASYDAVEENGIKKIIITNKEVAEKTTIAVKKLWQDDDNANGKRPAEIKVKLMADGQQKGGEITLNQANGWEYSWENVEKYRNNIIDDGEILYTVVETVPEKYKATYKSSFENGVKTITIKNTYEKETTSFKVEKVWDDNDNANGKRPEYILATPYLNGVPCGQSVVLSNTNGWSYTWTGYLKYKGGIESNELNNYTVVETVPEEYTASYQTTEEDGVKKIIITNKEIPEKTSISVEKIWDDNDNINGKRPEYVLVKLYKGDVQCGPGVYLSDRYGWNYTWTGLPKYEDGMIAHGEIEYTVKEEVVTEYSCSYSTVMENGVKKITITNKYTPEKTNINIKKIWDDGDDVNQKRPSVTKVTLYADGIQYGQSVYLSESFNNWEYTWRNLQKYRNGNIRDGKVYYNIVEELIEGYTVKYSKIEKEDSIEFLVTNKYTPEKTSIAVKKKWADNEDSNGKRPATVMVTLYADNIQNGPSVYLNEGDGWNYTWNNLPKYRDGIETNGEIDYTIQETVPEGYTDTYRLMYIDGVKTVEITNTYVAEKTSVSVEKVWDDKNDANGKRPATVMVTLYADNVQNGQSVYLNDVNGWNYTWNNLPKYKDGIEANGVINYKVEEELIDGYTTLYNTEVIDGTKKITITNRYTPEKTSVSVEKVWDDNDNINKNRPENVMVTLYANGVQNGQSVYLSEGYNNWKYTWTGLPKYKNGIEANGEIDYTVKETVPQDYVERYTTTIQNGVKKITITNKYVPETTSIAVKKIWKDNNNSYGKRPQKVAVTLYADEVQNGPSVYLSEDYNNWKHIWTGLPKYRSGIQSYGEIKYEVREIIPDGYTDTYKSVYIDGVKTVELTNTYVTEKTSVSVEKVWDDNNNVNEKRPASVQVTLYANGIQNGSSVYLSDINGWDYTWNNLPKYKDGIEENGEINYTVEEALIDEYTTTYNTEVIDGTKKVTITNKYTPEKTSIAVEKVWNDNDNSNGERPTSVMVTLYANGVQHGPSVYLSENNNNWKHTWTNLTKYNDGEEENGEIKYTVEEVVPEGYKESYSIDIENGIKKIFITNSYIPEYVDISVEKIWDDNDNENGKRPSSIMVTPYADEIQCGPSLYLSELNDWKYTWKGLPKYRNGESGKVEIEYSVKENTVDEYFTAYDVVTDEQYGNKAIKIRNTYTAEKGSYDIIINKLDSYTNMNLDGAEFKITAEKDGERYELFDRFGNTIAPGKVTGNGELILKT